MNGRSNRTGGSLTWRSVLISCAFVACHASPTALPSETPDARPAYDQAARMDVDTRATCAASSDCALVHWGCCEDPCQDGPWFTAAVNRAFAADVPRITQCGKVCSEVMACAYQLTTSCENSRCVVHCNGKCPVEGEVMSGTAVSQPAPG